ncbi:hypothetical protein Tco_1033545 [Tanacetum coccineum]
MMHPGRLRGQLRKKLHWLKVESRYSENSERGNARKKDGFWVEVMEYIESKTKMEGRRTYDMVLGKWKSVRPVVVRFCGVYSNVMRMAQESGAGDEDYKEGFWVEVMEYIDEQNNKAKAAAKNKGSKASASSTMNDDALTKLVVTEMTATEVEQREKFIELKRREVECREREIAATEYRAQQEDMKLYLQQYDHLTGEQRLAWEEIRANIKAKYNLQF